MQANTTIISEIYTQLPKYGNADFAKSQQKYLKCSEPLLGLRVPEQRNLIRRIVQTHAPAGLSLAELLATARKLWDGATHREYRRSALMLLLLPKHAKLLDATAMPTIEHFIRTAAWWDLVDECVHTHNYIRQNSHKEFERMIQWAQNPDIWIRRYAILCQLQAKENTDTDLLSGVIVPNLQETEFFIAKAIGWALRDYARTNPQWVRAFLAQHPEIQPLSRREATKHLNATTEE